MTGLWSASPPGQAGRLPYLAVHGKLPFLFEMHWDHEPDRTIPCCSCNTNLSEHFPWFRESPLGLTIVHWDPEPRAVPRRTKSADKSDALQTLRAIRRRPAVAKRLECVRLQRRFPKAGCNSMAGQVPGKFSCQPRSVVVSAPKEAAPRRRRGLEQKRKQGKPP